MVDAFDKHHVSVAFSAPEPVVRNKEGHRSFVRNYFFNCVRQKNADHTQLLLSSSPPDGSRPYLTYFTRWAELFLMLVDQI